MHRQTMTYERQTKNQFVYKALEDSPLSTVYISKRTYGIPPPRISILIVPITVDDKATQEEDKALIDFLVTQQGG